MIDIIINKKEKVYFWFYAYFVNLHWSLAIGSILNQIHKFYKLIQTPNNDFKNVTLSFSFRRAPRLAV